MAFERARNCFVVFLECVSIAFEVWAVFVCEAGIYFSEARSDDRVISVAGMCLCSVLRVVVWIMLVVLWMYCVSVRGIKKGCAVTH